MRKFKIISSLLILSCLILSPISTVKATTLDSNIKLENIKPFDSTDKYIEFFNENNVPKDKQDILLNKLDNDILWDCYNPQKTSEIPEDFYAFDIDDPVNNKRYYRFEDGSFISIETEGSAESDKGRSTTSDSFGTMYKDHMVSKQVGLAGAGFRADFYVARYGTSSFVGDGNIWDRYATGLGCSGLPAIEKVRLAEEVASPNNRAAIVRIYWQSVSNVTVSWPTKGFTVGASIPVGATMSLYLALVNNKYYVDSQLPSNIYN
ncbi:hypothetical protein [Clostridium sp.]|uniref:hypothetical protein n=1 Tax=Clostridium sp. TaxID=1506 RepID=UPI003F31BAFA